MQPLTREVAIVRQWYAAYGARDIDALCRLAHPDIEILPVGAVLARLVGTTFHGHAGLRTLMRWSYENHTRMRLESSSCRPVSGSILAAATFVVEDRSPEPIKNETHALCLLVGERMRRMRIFETEREALAAATGAARVGCDALLTRRQREILQLLARGLNAPQIAAELFLAPTTVRTHVQNAMMRLEATTRVHAVSLALERGEIHP